VTNEGAVSNFEIFPAKLAGQLIVPIPFVNPVCSISVICCETQCIYILCDISASCVLLGDNASADFNGLLLDIGST